MRLIDLGGKGFETLAFLTTLDQHIGSLGTNFGLYYLNKKLRKFCAHIYIYIYI